MEDAFHCFDRKGEGYVTKQELGFIFQVLQIPSKKVFNFQDHLEYVQNLGGGVELTEKEIESLLLEVDVDGDGVIRYDEFFGLAINT